MLSGIKRTAGTSVAARSARFNMLDCSSVRKRCLTPLPSLPDFQRIWNRFFVIYAPPLKGCWKKLRQPTGSCADWLYTHLMRCQPNLGYLEILHYHIYPIRMVRARHPSVQSFHPSFHQGHKLPSSIALPTTKRATCLFYCCDHSFCFFLSFSSFPTVPLPHFPQPLLDRDIPYSFSFPQPHLTQARVHISHIVDVKQRVHHAKAIRLPSPTHTKEGSVSQVSSLLRDQHAHMYAILVS